MNQGSYSVTSFADQGRAGNFHNSAKTSFAPDMESRTISRGGFLKEVVTWCECGYNRVRGCEEVAVCVRERNYRRLLK